MSTTARAPVNEEEFLGALYKGGELLAAGKIVEARSFLEKAHQLAPKNEKAQNLLGLTYFKLGLFDQASDIYEKLVRENPADPTLRVNLGLVYLKTNNLPRCIKEFETATDLEPDHKKAHNYLGLALAQAGDYAKAKEHFVLAGSEQMAEKMGRALTARVESAPSNHGLVVPPAPPAVAQAVTSQPAQLITPKPSGPPPPLPPASQPEEEIEVMSESEVMDADVVSGEQVIPIEQLMVTRPAPVPEPIDESGPLEGAPIEETPIEAAPVEAAPVEVAPVEVERFEAAPVEAAPIEVVEERPVEFTEERPLEPMPAEVDITPPAPSGPRLDRDWGAQFGMEPEATAPAEAATTASADELPMIDVESEVSTQKVWVAPLVNSWDAASGMTPPPPSAPGERSVNVDPSAFVGSPSPAPQMETALDPAAEDPLWNAARSASGGTAEPAPVAESTDWNTPPDPNQEMNFADVAPQESAAPAAASWSEPSTDASWEQPAPEQPPYDPAGAEAQPVEQQGVEGQPAEQQTWQAQQTADALPAEQQAWAEEQRSVPAEQQRWDAPPAEQQTWDAPPEQQTWDAPVEQQTWDASAEQQPSDGSDAQQAYDGQGDQQTWEQQPADAQPTAPDAAPDDDLARPTAPGWSDAPADAPPPVEPSWVAQPLSEFTPDNPPAPVQPAPSAPGRGYTPMEARTLVELGASTSDIEQPQAGPFHVGPHGLAVTVNGEMLTRMTNLVAIVGSVTAHPENRRARGRAVDQPFGEGPAQMQRLSGHGVVHLEMGGARFHALDLNDDSAYLREEHVFGFEETIGFEHGHLSEDGIKLGLDLVHLSGDGRVLLQLGGAMKSLAIPPGSPMMVPLQRLVGWFGRVSPRLTGFAGQGAVELTGDGFALLVTPG